MKHTKKQIAGITCMALALLMLAMPLCLASCKIKTSGTNTDTLETTETSTDKTAGETSPSGTSATVNMTEIRAEIDSLSTSDFEETDEVTEYVLIRVKRQGDIILRLRSDIAPETVKNFQNLVSKGHYNGLTFHRVIANFMIQGGDPKGNGTGGTTPIKGEMTNNGFENNLSHIRGVLSMARRGGDYDSGSCQFFICNADSTYLDKEYATFGYVVAGMDTVDSISAEATNSSDKPLTDVVMSKVCFVKKTIESEPTAETEVASTDHYHLNNNHIAILKYQDAYQSLYYNCLYYSYGMTSYAIDFWDDLSSYSGYPDIYAIEHVSAFMDALDDSSAYDTAKKMLIYCEGAKADGLTLSEAEKEESMNDIACINFDMLEACADTMGVSLSAYLNAYIGNGVSKDDVEEVLEMYALANAYAEKKSEELLASVTRKEAADYRDENKSDFYTGKYTSYVLPDQEWREAVEKCHTIEELKKVIVEKLLDDGFADAYQKQFADAEVVDTAGEEKTKETVLASLLYRAGLSEQKTAFDAAWDEEDFYVTLDGYAKAGDQIVRAIYISAKIQFNRINEEDSVSYAEKDQTALQKWLFAEGRKTGDVTVIKTESDVYTWCLVADEEKVMIYDTEKTRNGYYVQLKDDTVSDDDSSTPLTAADKYRLVEDAADLEAREKVFTDKLGTSERTGLSESSLSSVGDELTAWFYSSDRKEGDYARITIGEGDDAKDYAVLFLKENEETWFENAKSAAANERLERWLEDSESKYHFEMDYEPSTEAETA